MIIEVNKFLSKIKNNFLIIKNELKQDIKEYSVKLAVVRFLGSIFRIIKINSLSDYFQNKKNDLVISYLEKKYLYVFLKYQNIKDLSIANNYLTAPIWICWFDGIEFAPPLVKRCIESIYNHANGHPVNLITWDNISDYIDIPIYIQKKVLNKQMSYAHYADIVRIFLLEKYGGIWLDATIFCTQELPDEYFRYDFFSCKSNVSSPGCISQNRWTTFCIGGKKGHILFKVLKEFFLEYWKKEKHAIDYLFFDDAIDIAYRLIPKVQNDIDSIPLNNIRRDEMIGRFANIWNESSLNDLLESKTILFKLGYREKVFLQKYTSDHKLTIYGAFIEELF